MNKLGDAVNQAKIKFFTKEYLNFRDFCKAAQFIGCQVIKLQEGNYRYRLEIQKNEHYWSCRLSSSAPCMMVLDSSRESDSFIFSFAKSHAQGHVLFNGCAYTPSSYATLSGRSECCMIMPKNSELIFFGVKKSHLLSKLPITHFNKINERYVQVNQSIMHTSQGSHIEFCAERLKHITHLGKGDDKDLVSAIYQHLINSDPIVCRVNDRCRLLFKAIWHIYREPFSICSVEHLSAMSATNIRNLQITFREGIDISVSELIRAIKINEFHKQLEYPCSEERLKITELAETLGIKNYGRFAGDYYRYLDEYPLETYKRGLLSG